MSFDDGFLLGLMLGGGDGGGGDDEWTLPENWLDIPEPESNQITILIDTYFSKEPLTFGLMPVLNPGTVIVSGKIDWGDGTVDEFAPGAIKYSHEYENTGQYIVTITGNETFNLFHDTSTNIKSCGSQSILAIKFGELMGVYILNNLHSIHLVYMKFKGKLRHRGDGVIFELISLVQVDIMGKYPEDGDFQINAFNNCHSLRKAPFTKNLKTLPHNMFLNCWSLKEVDLSSAVSIEGAVFNNCYNLKEINAPLLENMDLSNFSVCYSLKSFSAPKLETITYSFNRSPLLEVINTPMLISASDNCFQDCYSLRKFIYADDCNFNGNTFSDCPQLYPKPE